VKEYIVMNILTNSFDILKKYYDKNLNVDKTLFETSNDEPTPIGCIEEMLSKVPEELWKRDNLKILDPCGGNGNFHLINFQMIKKYNPEKQPEKIINDNLFYNDINKKRIEVVKNIFNSYKTELNLTEVDFLNYPEDTKYDLQTVNPPYAHLLLDEKTKKWKRASKNHNLIKPFIKKSLSLCKEGGYIVYITPDNWMSLADRNTLIKELTEYQFIWLDIGSAKKKWFSKVGSSFTWYIIQKTKGTKPFGISGNYKNFEYNDIVETQIRDYIPLIYNKTIQSILTKVIDNDKNKYKVETSSDLHKYTKKKLILSTKDEIFKYKLIHTPSQIVYSSRPHKFQDGYKVFISTTDHYKTFVDECGMTQSIAFIRCNSKEEAENIKKCLDNKLFKFINDICRWGNFNCIRILQRFPIVNDVDNIFEEFDITQDEVNFINNILDNYSVKPRVKKVIIKKK